MPARTERRCGRVLLLGVVFRRAMEAIGLRWSDTALVVGVVRRVLVTWSALTGAFVIGGLLCLVKGEGAGLAMAIGNLSAPYVIVAVFAGLTVHRWWLGVLVGVVSTEAIVAGFYATWAAYFGHEVSVSSVLLWGGAGLFSGALFGMIGWAARVRRGLRYVLPALLLFEPAATEVAAPLLARVGVGYGWGVVDFSSVGAYLIEAAAGVVAFVLVRRHLRAVRRRDRDLASA